MTAPPLGSQNPRGNGVQTGSNHTSHKPSTTKQLSSNALPTATTPQPIIPTKPSTTIHPTVLTNDATTKHPPTEYEHAPTCPTNSINYFTFMNIQGLKPETVPSKIPFLSDILDNKNQLFIGLSETWIHNHLEGELQIDGYKMFRADSSQRKENRGRATGGVAIYLRSDIATMFEVLSIHSSSTNQLLVLHSQIENLILASVYR